MNNTGQGLILDHEESVGIIDGWYDHIRVFAEEIGPRGPTIKSERKAADYCQSTFMNLGLEANVERLNQAG